MLHNRGFFQYIKAILKINEENIEKQRSFELHQNKGVLVNGSVPERER